MCMTPWMRRVGISVLIHTAQRRRRKPRCLAKTLRFRVFFLYRYPNKTTSYAPGWIMQSKTDRKVWIFIECEYRLSRSDYPTKKHANHATHYRIYLLYFTHSSEDTFRACNRQRLVYRKKNTKKNTNWNGRKLEFVFWGFSLDFLATNQYMFIQNIYISYLQRKDI